MILVSSFFGFPSPILFILDEASFLSATYDWGNDELFNSTSEVMHNNVCATKFNIVKQIVQSKNLLPKFPYIL